MRWLDAHLDELRGICDACLDEEDRGVTQLARLFAFDARLREEGTTAFARERLVALSAPALKTTYGRKGNWDDPALCARMKELVTEYAALREQLRGSLRAVALLGLLPHLEEFVRDYEEERRARGVADFDDLLIWARDLVRDNQEVRAYFQRRFSALLIDEFQDTDPIQVELAALLTAENVEDADWRSAHPSPGKLFVVGDPKQSIYRFRRADIGIYDEVKRDLLDGGLRRLSQNFRSLPGVIGWVNRVFDSLLEERPGVQPANVPLQAVDVELPLDRPPVIVVRGGNDQLDATGVRAAEARATAALLRQAVIDERWPVRDRVTGEVREACWRDVAILLPTRTGLDTYEEALALAGVPYRHEGSRDYFRRQEVRDLIALLRAIDDPSDRLSLIGALRSSAFGCSDEDLVVHLGSGGAWDYRITKAEGQSEAVSEAFELLRGLHRARGRLSLSELVQRVVEESRLVEFALTLPDGPQAAANLLAIVDGARAFTAAGGGGLRAFTRHLADSTENEAVEVDAGIAEETDDVVRLLTIHGAKGLEFPIVVLANLGSGVQTSREPVPDEAERQLHFRVGSGGRGRSGHYSTPGFDARWEAESAALDAERIRLLYVAATRARDHLVVPFIRGKRKPGPFLTALEGHLPDVDGHEIEVDGAWLLDADQLPEPPVDERVPAPVSDEEVERALAERETWITDHKELTRAARAELPFVVASSMERARRPLAAEASHSGATLLVSEGPPLPVGDALHLVMERVTLPDAADLDDVVSAVCAEAAIPEREDEVLEMARRCLASPTVKRALESGEWWREVPFTVQADGGFAVGRVDLVFRDDGRARSGGLQVGRGCGRRRGCARAGAPRSAGGGLLGRHGERNRGDTLSGCVRNGAFGRRGDPATKSTWSWSVIDR